MKAKKQKKGNQIGLVMPITVVIKKLDVDPSLPKKAKGELDLGICINNYKGSLMTIGEAEHLVDNLQNAIDDLKSSINLQDKLSDIIQFIDSLMDIALQTKDFLDSGNVGDAQDSIDDMDSDLKDLEQIVDTFNCNWFRALL